VEGRLGGCKTPDRDGRANARARERERERERRSTKVTSARIKAQAGSALEIRSECMKEDSANVQITAEAPNYPATGRLQRAH